MRRIDYKHIYRRTRQFLMKPEIAWQQVMEENIPVRGLFQDYLLPIAVVTSLLVFLLSLLHVTVFQAIGLGIINLISILCGIWFSFLIMKAYLCEKLNYRDNQALNLTVYSAVIFTFFHSIGAALGNMFLGQLFTLLSFIFIRTLYIGLGQLRGLPSNQKTNVFVIATLCIICIPIIITHILMIVFRSPAFNI